MLKNTQYAVINLGKLIKSTISDHFLAKYTIAILNLHSQVVVDYCHSYNSEEIGLKCLGFHKSQMHSWNLKSQNKRKRGEVHDAIDSSCRQKSNKIMDYGPSKCQRVPVVLHVSTCCCQDGLGLQLICVSEHSVTLVWHLDLLALDILRGLRP